MVWTKNPDYEPKTKEQKFGYLVEELGEVQQAAGKCLRFGLFNHNPETGLLETNAEMLLRELDDLEGAIKLFREELLGIPELKEKLSGQLSLQLGRVGKEGA
jgi:hypothetical protein